VRATKDPTQRRVLTVRQASHEIGLPGNSGLLLHSAHLLGTSLRESVPALSCVDEIPASASIRPLMRTFSMPTAG